MRGEHSSGPCLCWQLLCRRGTGGGVCLCCCGVRSEGEVWECEVASPLLAELLGRAGLWPAVAPRLLLWAFSA